MGERSLRSLLIIGANSFVIKRHVHAAAKPGTRLGGMLPRKPSMLVRVALANKMARIVWILMARGGVHKAPSRRHKSSVDREDIGVEERKGRLAQRS